MAAFQGGDMAAFETLVARHERKLWSFVLRMTRDSAASEDIVQEAFVRVVRARATWRPSAKFSTWLYTIARHLVIDGARQRKSRSEAGFVETPLAFEEARVAGEMTHGPELGPGDVRSAVEALPLEQRDVFLLKELQSFTFEEIAEVTGVALGTAKSRYRYAVERLRTALAGERDPASDDAMDEVARE